MLRAPRAIAFVITRVSGFRAQGLWFRVWGLGLWLQGVGPDPKLESLILHPLSAPSSYLCFAKHAGMEPNGVSRASGNML